MLRSKNCRFILADPSLLAVLLWLSLVAAIVSPAGAQVDDSLWTMYRDPKLPTPDLEIVFHPDLVPLWLQALERPERDLKRRAASTIAEARRRDVPGLESTIPVLEKLVSDPGEEQMVRLAAARALVALDAKPSAALLWEHLPENDVDMAEIVEPALARWSFEPAAEMWLSRLNGPIQFRRQQVLAMQGLAALGQNDAIPRLRERATDRRVPVVLRIAAADALGRLQKTGLLEVAQELSSTSTPDELVDRLVAVKMLAGHRGPETEQTLAKLAIDPMPSVQAIALDQLMNIDPLLVMPLVDQLIDSRDANVRRLIAESLVQVARQPRVDNVARLGPLLDDRNPTLRIYVRDSLIELAKLDGFHDAVIEQGRNLLTQDSWRGQEQAIRLLVALNDQQVVDRYLELLDSPRPEVHTTAAWGLCELGVPSTVEPIFQVFEKKTALALAYEPQTPDTQIQLAHLAQSIGKFKYQPAESVLREYIPKLTALQPVSRAAAIYALGHLYADRNDKDLAELLRQRMMDTLSLEPEDPLVRRFCAISLGRMKAEQTLPSLIATLAGVGVREATGISAAWAINQITGEPIPEVTPYVHRDNNWFLVPEQR